MSIERRKADHIRINLEEDVNFPTLTTGLERYAFVHQALPELDLDSVDLSLQVFGKTSDSAHSDQLHDRRHCHRRRHQSRTGGSRANLWSGDGLGQSTQRYRANRKRRNLQGPRRGPRSRFYLPILEPYNSTTATASMNAAEPWIWWRPTPSFFISTRCKKPYSQKATPAGAASSTKSPTYANRCPSPSSSKKLAGASARKARAD